ncbi:hypothetical protein ECNIH5_14275 [Enterobacter cloacae]|uniref:hypothetical protein n=1 Tax=Enterobacter cloacae complex TaxID=354276 RepID=UPI0004F7EAC4|nr:MULTISPECIES: hypothetical protein [Enterobacter cloacae complex]AIX59860.1 hypothetical protein ECNIH5_14275 [Enterobacter cloacae]AIN23448.1 hypothetical protein ECNIH3_14350 [Enterobacter hormaechei subsp. hoffmannii ECNIH3]AIN28786.1 hypothetical protein ECR091_14285 [Enterobacter hormaechei subsp. hoffmannii ECR091]EKS6640571.1 hypothetical protein [Enterobacter hormaechei]ELD2070319.1 hypothetical protein [Enterobacter hormaechei]
MFRHAAVFRAETALVLPDCLPYAAAVNGLRAALDYTLTHGHPPAHAAGLRLWLLEHAEGMVVSDEGIAAGVLLVALGELNAGNKKGRPAMATSLSDAPAATTTTQERQ